jgi:iron uptake system component EfeO
MTFCIVVAAIPPAKAEPVGAGVERYRSYLVVDIDRSLAEARNMRERLSARDLAGAQKAWIDARVGWERSEVFTSGFVPQLDAGPTPFRASTA